MLVLAKQSRKLLLRGAVSLLLIAVLAVIIPDLIVLPSHIPCSIALILLTIFNYQIGKKDVFYPGFIFNAIWALVFSLYTFSFVEVIDISLYTDFIFVVGALAFTVSCYLAQQLPALRYSHVPARPISQNTAKIILLCYIVLVCPFFYRDIVSLTGGNLSLTLIRVALVDSTQSGQSFYTNPFARVLPLTSVMVAIVWFISDRNSKRSRFSYAAAVLSFLIALLTTGRPQIVQLFLSLPTVVLFVPYRGLSFRAAIRKAALPFTAMFLILSLVPLITKTTAPSSGSSGDLIGYASSLFIWYIIGSVAAFDIFLRHPFPYGAKLDFVSTPFGINTYTAFLTPYQIAGFFGIVIFSLFAGCFHGYLYRVARNGSETALFLYSICLYPLVMSMFSDQYFSIGIFFYLEIFVFAFGYYFYLHRFTFLPQSDATEPQSTAIFQKYTKPN